MSALWQWIQTLQGYCALKDTMIREGSRPSLENLEQEHARMLSVIHELQRTADPLVAAQIYNNRFNRFAGLPEELLLRILEFVGDDPSTLHSLRIVSRTFFRLTYEPRIWGLICHTYLWNFPLSVPQIGQPLILKYDMLRRLKVLLERDRQCDNCRRWDEDHPQSNVLQTSCKFRAFEYQTTSIVYNTNHCDACGVSHNPYQFSTLYPQGEKQKRQCLGYEGSVKLCEHVQIYWASIRDYISNWQQWKPEGWHNFLRDFSIECHDPSHDMRCTPENAPTWPRARLQIAMSNPELVVLNLEWTHHSHLDVLTGTDAPLPLRASDLRTIFREFRQGPAGTLFSPSRPDHFPELVPLNQTDCVQYEIGDISGPPCHMTASLMPQSRLRFQSALHHYDSGAYGLGENGHRIDISFCRPWGVRNTRNSNKSTCLLVTYQCDILVCKTTDSTKINPSHNWLHAMDPDTYRHPQGSHIKPLCKDKTCMNYYQTRRESPPCCSVRHIEHDLPSHVTRFVPPFELGIQLQLGLERQWVDQIVLRSGSRGTICRLCPCQVYSHNLLPPVSRSWSI